MTEYYLNETVVTFPGNIIQDSTINMLRLSDPDAALIISRGQMQEGDELASQIEQQMKKLEKQVKDLHYTPVQVTRVGINDGEQGLEIQSQFLRGNEQVYQCQVAFVWPGAQPDGRDGAQDGVRVRRLRASGHAHERERRTLPVPP